MDRFDTTLVGDEVEFCRTITAKDVDAFADLTGDTNPLHMQDEFAVATSFRKRVVHGMLTASFISTMIGTKLPGAGALWFEQHLRFLAPVWIGEKIRVLAKVKHKSQAQRILSIETLVFGEDGRKVIEGEAKVKLLKPGTGEAEAGKLNEEPKGAVIVTGASRGIGAAIALELAAHGHPIVVNYARSPGEAEKVSNQIVQAKGVALPFRADVANPGEIDAMVKFAQEEFGTLEGVVNNASPRIDPFDFVGGNWEQIQRHLDIQVKGAFSLCRAVLPALLVKKSGVIVNIGSIFTDNVPPIKLFPYILAKAALVQMTRCLAAEFGPQGIRVNCVSPGMTDTELISNLPEKTKMLTKMQSPLRRLALPEDIAGVVAFLFSKRARHITGENIRVCGGIVMV
jgi:3-oxoacyl-[acyl-carrier protein] reductase